MTVTKILLVEDNQIEQKVMTLLGEKVGVTVVCADSACQAIEMLSGRHEFAMILMDWILPDMSGLECTRKIRAMEQHTGKRVPIVAVTAKAFLGDRQKCLDAGMDDYLSKPFTFHQFQIMLARWLNMSSRRTVSA